MFLIEQLERRVADGRKVPLSTNVVIDQPSALDLIDQLRVSVPEEVRQAQRITREQDRILENAQAEADRIVARAQEQAAFLIEERELTRAAEKQSARIVTEAENQASSIRMGADDPSQSRYLARRQERELRRNIEEWRSEYRDSFRASLLTIRDEVEDTHRVEIEAVIRDDAPINPSLAAAIEAAREAMANAAKHSGSRNISLYSEFANGEAHIHVRDSGTGFATDGQRNRVRERLAKRVENVGGLVEIDTAPESGTEIKIIVDR